MVAVDGLRVRSIRETKRLTQLYVASVVGVTTDTISRWENNRYPTIKRENAEKLAGALEVELAAILREEEPLPEPASAGAPSPAAARSRLRWPALVLAALLLLAGGVFLLFHQQAGPTALRKLPRFTPPGEILPVQIVVSGDTAGGKGLILRESLPPGWRLLSAAPPAANPRGTTEEVKWLLAGGSGRHTVSYTVQPPPTAPLQSAGSFSGRLVIRSDGNARTIPVAGESSVLVTGRHWADTNGDGRIDDNEIMPAYYLCEEMKGLGLEWKTIEAIWNGKGYRWDGTTRAFIVVN